MEREYQSGHLTVLLSTTGTWIQSEPRRSERLTRPVLTVGGSSGVKATPSWWGFPGTDSEFREQPGILPATP